MSVQSEMTALANQVRRLSGEAAALGISAMTAALAGVTTGGGGGSGVTVTEYIVTENADRSLWLNEQGIKLLKGVNLLVSGKMFYNTTTATWAQGAVTAILMLWDGAAGKANASIGSGNNKSHIRGYHIPQGAYAMFGTVIQLNSGYTSEFAVAEDGMLTCTTSATGVTTNNYNNSFIEGGYTYYLMQAPSEEVC